LTQVLPLPSTFFGSNAITSPSISQTTSAAGVPQSASSTSSQSSSGLGSLTSNDFLQLLVTQLTNQDPSNPVDPTQMIAQTATLTMVQDLQSLQQSVAQLQQSQAVAQASALISQQVTYQDSSGNSQSGLVSSVSVGPSGPLLNIGGAQVPLSQVTQIS
jgi:flagellar basal-body rod modification protein FlgD